MITIREISSGREWSGETLNDALDKIDLPAAWGAGTATWWPDSGLPGYGQVVLHQVGRTFGGPTLTGRAKIIES